MCHLRSEVTFGDKPVTFTYQQIPKVNCNRYAMPDVNGFFPVSQRIIVFYIIMYK